ncbi:MAG: hypothetical protein QOF00_5272 [Pseudonocardiales bacterium]|jgi:hypothetical protein|nr:hypothetical protein [Pseudonocardiales bacterium]
MTTDNSGADLEALTKRVQELSAQVAEKARENGLAWLEGYERMLMNLLDLEEQAAKGSGADWAASLASSHANFVRSTSEAVFGVLRAQLKT